MTIEGAHTKGTEVGSLVFSVDGRTILTRGGDDTVKRTLFFSRVLHDGVKLTCHHPKSMGPSLIQEAPRYEVESNHALSDNKCNL